MSEQDVRKMIDGFEKFFGAQFAMTTQAVADYISEFKNTDARQLEWATTEIKRNGFRPSIAMVYEYTGKAREAGWRDQKNKEMRRTFPTWARPAKSGLIASGFPLIHKFLSNEITREQYVTGLDELEKEFPGRGCGAVAESLRRFYVQREAKQEGVDIEFATGEAEDELGVDSTRKDG